MFRSKIKSSFTSNFSLFPFSVHLSISLLFIYFLSFIPFLILLSYTLLFVLFFLPFLSLSNHFPPFSLLPLPLSLSLSHSFTFSLSLSLIKPFSHSSIPPLSISCYLSAPLNNRLLIATRWPSSIVCWINCRNELATSIRIVLSRSFHEH